MRFGCRWKMLIGLGLRSCLQPRLVQMHNKAGHVMLMQEDKQIKMTWWWVEALVYACKSCGKLGITTYGVIKKSYVSMNFNLFFLLYPGDFKHLSEYYIKPIFLKSDFWDHKITKRSFIKRKPHKSWNNASCGNQSCCCHDETGWVPGSCGSACVLAECKSCQPQWSDNGGGPEKKHQL